MKFVHTADWQVGMKAEGLGPAGASVREERLASGRRVVDVALTDNADFMLVAGDLFEDNGVSRILIQKTADILAKFHKQVYIIPGNHDPFVPGSVWEHPAWNSANNLHILTDNKPIQIPGGVLYPCPVTDKYSTKDPTAWIRAESDHLIHVAMAHGNVDGLPNVSTDHPIPRNAAERCGLHYLALGHWHSTVTFTDSMGKLCMAYCGTPETSRFGESDSGNTLLVTIDDPDSPPETTLIRTGGLRWEVIEKDIRQVGDLGALRQKLEAFPNPQRCLVDLRLHGLLYAEELEIFRHIEDMLASRFLVGRTDFLDLYPSPDDDRWISALPPGVLRDAAIRLQNLADNRDRTPQHSQIASLALLELYVMTTEILK